MLSGIVIIPNPNNPDRLRGSLWKPLQEEEKMVSQFINP
jgi:hypothetical protein